MGCAITSAICCISTPEAIEARIELDNRCGLRDSSFVVIDLQTGKRGSFRNGIARLKTTERNRIRIEFAPNFPGTSLSSVSLPASRNMVMVAECDTAGWLPDLW